MSLVQLFPCGLPSILHNNSYSSKDRDKVEMTCCELQKHNICSDEIFKECIENHLDELVEAQIKIRENFNKFKRR